MNKSLYLDMVNVAKEYLGPAAERFMSRHITTHLNIEPSEITIRDIPELLEWLKISMALLTPDSKLVNDFSNNIEALIK